MMVCNEIRLTNAQYFAKYCYISDLPRIIRMFEKHLDASVGRDAPRHEKELEYDKWLDDLFDGNEWEQARATDDTLHWW